MNGRLSPQTRGPCQNGDKVWTPFRDGAYSQAKVSIWIPRSQRLTGSGDYQETKVLQKVCIQKQMNRYTCMKLASVCMLVNVKL